MHPRIGLRGPEVKAQSGPALFGLLWFVLLPSKENFAKEKLETQTKQLETPPAFPTWHHLGFDTRFLFPRALSRNSFDILLLMKKYKRLESVSISICKKTKQTPRPAQPCRKQVLRNITKNLFPLIFNIMGALKGNISLL